MAGPGDEHDSRCFREVMDGIRVRYGGGGLEPGPARLPGLGILYEGCEDVS